MKTNNFTDQEIQNKIEELYKDEKGKRFISHLLRSFFPAHKTEYLWSPPADISTLKCCITGNPLISKDEILQIEYEIVGEKMKLFSKSIIEQFENENENKDKEKASEHQKALSDLLEKHYKGRLLAVSSKESNKYMTIQVHQALFNWMTTKILSGDNQINWIMKSMRKNEALKFAKEKQIPVSDKEKSTLNKSVNNPHKMNLMDNEVLKNLADKFKNEEK